MLVDGSNTSRTVFSPLSLVYSRLTFLVKPGAASQYSGTGMVDFFPVSSVKLQIPLSDNCSRSGGACENAGKQLTASIQVKDNVENFIFRIRIFLMK
jgi:hypothetical protein